MDYELPRSTLPQRIAAFFIISSALVFPSIVYRPNTSYVAFLTTMSEICFILVGLLFSAYTIRPDTKSNYRISLNDILMLYLILGFGFLFSSALVIPSIPFTDPNPFMIISFLVSSQTGTDFAVEYFFLVLMFGAFALNSIFLFLSLPKFSKNEE